MAEQDRVDVPLVPVMLVGLRLQVKPDGDTVAVRETVPPEGLLIAQLEVPVDPAGMVTLGGVHVILKPVVTVTITVAVCESVPLVPVTATVNVLAADAVHERVEV